MKTSCQDKIIQAFGLSQGLKEIDSILVILKESKSWKKKKKKRKLDTTQKTYVRNANTNMLFEQIYDYNYTLDIHSLVVAIGLKSCYYKSLLKSTYHSFIEFSLKLKR